MGQDRAQGFGRNRLSNWWFRHHRLFQIKLAITYHIYIYIYTPVHIARYLSIHPQSHAFYQATWSLKRNERKAVPVMRLGKCNITISGPHPVLKTHTIMCLGKSIRRANWSFVVGNMDITYNWAPNSSLLRDPNATKVTKSTTLPLFLFVSSRAESRSRALPTELHRLHRLRNITRRLAPVLNEAPASASWLATGKSCNLTACGPASLRGQGAGPVARCGFESEEWAVGERFKERKVKTGEVWLPAMRFQMAQAQLSWTPSFPQLSSEVPGAFSWWILWPTANPSGPV